MRNVAIIARRPKKAEENHQRAGTAEALNNPAVRLPKADKDKARDGLNPEFGSSAQKPENAVKITILAKNTAKWNDYRLPAQHR